MQQSIGENVDNSNDFTLTHYRELLSLAQKKYPFSRYCEVSGRSTFILWRHDLDLSLNRALHLAKIEHELGITATYFLNPHCEFYNLHEKGQFDIVRQIQELGHDIALHFDAGFHNVICETSLDDIISREKQWLTDWFGQEPTAVSFHNPDAFLMSCNAEYYGGLINCYSKTFMENIDYCSDSNGYWRFQRLKDVLLHGEGQRLQVLTHPGWWQNEPMPPRSRVYRCAYGKAEALMREYDNLLAEKGRDNKGQEMLLFMRNYNQSLYLLCDYLWQRHHCADLLTKLRGILETQLRLFCDRFIAKRFQVSSSSRTAFFACDEIVNNNAVDLFQSVLGEEGLLLLNELNIRSADMLISKSSESSKGIMHSQELKEECQRFSSNIEKLSCWGTQHPMIDCSGLQPKDWGLEESELEESDFEQEDNLEPGSDDIKTMLWKDFQLHIIKGLS